jgi:hypothetical protein
MLSPELFHAPGRLAMTKTIAHGTISPQVGAHMHGGAVDINRQTAFRHGEVGNRDGRCTIAWRYRHLLRRMKPMHFEQTQKSELQRRTDTGRIGLQPWTRIVNVSDGCGLPLGPACCERFDVWYGQRPA